MTTRLQTAPIDPADLALLRRQVASRLRQLRLATNPRLSQTAAATYLGLSESTGYRSVGQWESGEVIPSSTVRPQFRRYLWQALGLHARPDEFAALWEEIAIAWDWPPLTATDWAELRSFTGGPAQAAPPVNGALSSAEPLAITVPEPATGVSMARPQPQPRRLALALLLAGALALVVLSVAAFAPNFIIANPLLGRGAPAPGALAANLGFEAAQGLAPWAVVGNAECAQRVSDAAAAYSGEHFLRIDTTDAGCDSLRYDLANPPALGATARFAVWARAAGPVTEALELVLWPGRRTDGEPVMGVKQFARFTVDDTAWRCLEVALPVVAQNVDLLRAEIYFDAAAQIDLDEASIHFDGQSACQGQTPRLINPSFETGARHLGWSFLPEDRCTWEVVTDRAGSHAGRRYLRIDRAAAECASLYQDLPAAPAPGVTYRARIWVRAAGDAPVLASWTLWALGEEAVSSASQLIATDEWRCVETALTPPIGVYERLRAELYFDAPDVLYAVDDAALTLGGDPLCPPQALLLNPGFEAETVAPWQEIGQCLAPPADGQAHSGAGFAQVEKSAACASLFQDVYTAIEPGAATFSVWLRATGATPARGQLALRAIGDKAELAETAFNLTDANWTCLEVTLEPQLTGHRHWRPEIYFSTEGAAYAMDDAALTLGLTGACPQTNYAVRRLEWLPGTVAYPGSGVSGVVEVENLAAAPTAWPHSLRYWLAATRNGPSLYDEASGAVAVPMLAGDGSSGPLYFDLALPPALEPGKTYYLVLDTGATALPASQRRRALPLALEPCAAGSFYCDVPTGFWAQAEAERWYNAGITSGCRSETQPYRDLPFCPQQTLSVDTMAVFLLRHLTDPVFRPAQPYQGVYADVPESHRRSLWIEALHEQIGVVERSNCPQVEGAARFCPQAPLLREDLLRYLAAAHPLTPTLDAPSHFVDVAEDPALAALATVFWQAGILPDDDPACPDQGMGPRFCPQAPARRIDAAVWMVRAFGE